MSYLTVAELDTQLYPEIRVAISREATGDGSTVVAAAIDRALGLIQTRLAPLYHIAQEYQNAKPAEGQADTRNAVLLGMAKDFAIFYLYQNPASMPVHRFKAYEQSLQLLTELARGNGTLVGIAPAPAPEAPQGGQFAAWGSNPRRTNYF